MPEIEFIDAAVTLCIEYTDDLQTDIAGYRLVARCTIYLAPRGEGNCTIPFHRCHMRCFDFESGDELRVAMKSKADSLTIRSTSTELIASAPGMCALEGDRFTKEAPQWILGAQSVSVSARLAVIAAESPVSFSFEADATEFRRHPREVRRWVLR